LNKPNNFSNIRVVLSHTTHPGNIGAAARAMKTMGLQHLYLINPRFFPDPQATAMAAGADDVLQNAVVCKSIDEALQGVVFTVAMTARLRDISIAVKTPREAMPDVLQQAATHPVALLFGTEMSGLTNEEMGKAQLGVNIPAHPDFSSLNIAAAVQVVAYELSVAAESYRPVLPEVRPRHGAAEPSGAGVAASHLLPQTAGPASNVSKVQPATHERIEGFYEHLEKTLFEIGFFTTQNPARLMQRLRRLYSRTRLEDEEINILRGMLTVATEYNARLKKRYAEEHPDVQEH
jgi:tRNA/rRNA methyltransferase